MNRGAFYLHFAGCVTVTEQYALPVLWCLKSVYKVTIRDKGEVSIFVFPYTI